MIRREFGRGQRRRVVTRSLRDDVATDVGQRLGHGTEREDLLESVDTFHERNSALDEHRDRIDDERRNPRVGQHVRVIVE